MDRGEVGRAECVPVAPADDDDGRDAVSAGNCARSASARADSALVGTGTGDCWLEASSPISAIKAPETTITKSADTHEKRWDTMRPIFQILNN